MTARQRCQWGNPQVNTGAPVAIAVTATGAG